MQPSTNRLRLSVAQMTSTDDVNSNLDQVEALFLQARGEEADLLVFPENTLYMRVQSGTEIAGLSLEGAEVSRLRKMITGGETSILLTTPMKVAGQAKLSNTTILFRPGREPQCVYNKIHLFDVDVEGAPPVRESDRFVGGSGPNILGFNGWKFGLSICYDLRFAELYAHYSQKADVILIPSAFLVPTGEAHWHVLVRARAVESQCYVAAPAQSGEHRSGNQTRSTYGHSMVVDPWGKVLAELHESPRIHTQDLDKYALEKVRRQIPMDSHRRL